MNKQSTKGVSKTEKATKARKLIGDATDAGIKEIIDKFPGLSLYEIQKIAGSSLGLVDGSIRRLEKNGIVRVRHVLRGGRSTKQVFSSAYLQTNLSQVKLDKEAFSNPDAWENTAYLYALNRSSIGVSPTREPEWESKAVFEARTEIKKDKRSIIFEIPAKFRDFYLWENSKMDISVIDELVLLNLITEIPIVESNSKDESMEIRLTHRQWKK